MENVNTDVRVQKANRDLSVTWCYQHKQHRNINKCSIYPLSSSGYTRNLFPYNFIRIFVLSLLSIFEEFNIDCLNIPFSTKRITITNFCLGKHLIRDNDLLKDQRGSPAYISPDVLSGE